MIDSNQEFDAIVVGSGISGGFAAKELCEKGLKTLMIERGPAVEHRKDYKNEGRPPWEYSLRGDVTNKQKERQHVQQECYAYTNATKQYFADDLDIPYQTAPGTEFSWIRGNQLGGKSLLWARQSLRMSELDFEANKLDGHGNDWPIRYNDIAQWYSYVEKFVGISGSKENIDVLPDGEFQPPFALNAAEQKLKKRIESIYDDRKLIISRTAHLTAPTKQQQELGRYNCMARNECPKGCSFGAYFSTQSSTLPAAQRTGNLTVATDSIVHSVIFDPKTQRASAVKVLDANTLEEKEYKARMIFMCASTLGSTQILLNSKSEAFPNGLANSSGVLGHYLMDHDYAAVTQGKLPGLEEEYYMGRRPTGFLIPRFVNVKQKDKKYHRGYGFQGSVKRNNQINASARSPGLGESLKEKMQQPGSWNFFMQASIEILPRYENSVSLHPTKVDKWGIPQLVMNCELSENEHMMREDAMRVAKEMMEEAGCENVRSHIDEKRKFGSVIHEVGSARMGRDPKDSVLNEFNQAHDVPNLFVTDGASWCSGGWVNPSLTIMAMTARAVDHAVKLSNKNIL